MSSIHKVVIPIRQGRLSSDGMRQVKAAPHLGVEELERRYRRAQEPEPHERRGQ